MTPQRALAFAPGSVGNVAVGFDVLGHAVSAVGDRVEARRSGEPGVRITRITGVVTSLPNDPGANTAGVAVQALLEAAGRRDGFDLWIDKGIPLGSGLGGSAASAVAAVVAVDALLPAGFDRGDLLRFALRGEAAAAGSVHVDNVAPSLYGGMVLSVGIDDPIVTPIPVPPGIVCVLVHPKIQLSTREARAVLQPTVPLADVVWQHANLAGFLAGCYTSDLALIRASMADVMIEPQRKALIPGFDAAKAAALGAGALGCSISGAGPTVFAWSEAGSAPGVRSAMVSAFAAAGLDADSWISPVGGPGAHVLERT